MSMSTLRTLWQQPLIRAALIHIALLGSGWAIASGIASMLSLSVSVLGILLGYAVVNIALTGWLLRRRAVVEPEPDATADALAEFADEPLGVVIIDAKERLAMARKRVGRHTAMYQPLDRLVRLTRKIERRLAVEPELRPSFARSLNQDLPLIATTAEQYVGLAGQDLSVEENDSLMVAEGVLREALDRLETLSESDGKIVPPVISQIRMDTSTEVLAERMSADPDDAAKRATAARVSHSLRQAARSAADDFAGDLRRAADRVDEMTSNAGGAPANAVAIIDAAEAQVADASDASEKALRKQIRKVL